MAESMFSKESAKRQKEQSEKLAANELESIKKVNCNFSLAPSSKEKMHAKAKEMGISASSLLQLWINEHC